MFGNLFKKRPLEAVFGDAEALEARGELGEAKLAFDRAAARAEKEAPGSVARGREGAARCCDGIAKRRIVEAERLIRAGAHDLAREELAHAAETATSQALKDEARALAQSLVAVPQEDAVLDAPATDTGPADEELLALIMASWSHAQSAELERHGTPLFDALIALARGRRNVGIRQLKRLAEGAQRPVYVLLELAAAYLADGQRTAASATLRALLAALPDGDEAVEARLQAHRQLAQLCHDAGDAEGAERELMAACEALLDDPRPYLDLGNYLRTLGRAAEAVEVLRLCVGCFTEGEAEWPVSMELGLALLQNGEREAAHASLRSAASALQRLGATELPDALSAALASLEADAS